MSPEYLWLGLFILIGFTVEVATGFGSIIIALSLGALLLPIEVMLPILVCLNSVMNASLLLRLHGQVHWHTLLKVILPLMGLGMVVGVLLFPYLSNDLLKRAFGLLVLWFAIREGSKLWFQLKAPIDPGKWTAFWTTMAGVTHGLFASGGPLLVYSLSRTTLDKTQFRATLLATWLTLNLSYTLLFLYQQRLQDFSIHILYYLPVLLVAAIAGQYLHKRINEVRFKKIVYIMLGISSIGLLF